MDRHARKKTPLRDLRTYASSRAVRHPDCDYAGEIDVHLTLWAGRGEPFRDKQLAAMVCGNVEMYWKRLACRLYGYCLMPDHLHVLLSPADSGTPIAKWLDLFKSFTTHQFMRTGGSPPLCQRAAAAFWQRPPRKAAATR
jgi:REP element-mobilizing transposase RayT